MLRTAPAPLRGIVALEQGEREAARPLSRAEAVSLLARCAPYVNRDAGCADALLERAHELARTARTAALTFRRDGDGWPILAAL